jgi:Nucleotidyl transferase AbiEii toxin, Type IV TA system
VILADDGPALRAALDRASSELGLPVRQLEKDFWVTAVLRSYSTVFLGRFLFKGGTSLSKGWRLISRFSEDIDLLLLSEPGPDTEALLDAMTTDAERVCRGTATVADSTSGLARVVDVTFPRLPDTPKAPGMRRTIRLEPGVRGGPRPRSVVTVAPLAATGLPADLAAPYEDLQPFEVDTLHPSRTFVEKLFAVHGLALGLADDPERSVRGTEARHLYDLYFLADRDHSDALGALERDGSYPEMVADCEAVSARWFPDRPSTAPPGGFRNSPLLTNDAVAARIEGPFTQTMRELCYPGAERPTLQAVLDRLAAVPWL